MLPPLAPDRARALAAGLGRTHILVVGDAMLDKFIAGRVTRLSPEAPVPVVMFDHESHRIGGAVLMTRGDQGMWLLGNDVEGSLPAAAREVADVTGAGDTVIATLALALAAGATLVEAARLANEAAGIAVAKFGPAVVTPAELLRALDLPANA